MLSVGFGALVIAACATPRYRYDRLKAKDGVELRDLEDLMRDSRDPGSSAPGAGLALQAKVVRYDFAAEKDEYRIGANDTLNVFVVGHPEMSSQRVELGQIAGTTVQKNGKVHIPVIGELQAAGMTVPEFRESLRNTAAKFILEPQVSVEMLQYASQKFYVLGQVQRPGAFPVDGDTTLLEGLGFAGGVLPTGSMDGAYVVREGSVLPISLSDILLRGDVRGNVFMRHGDLLFVPDTSDRKVYVLGEVKQPTVVPVGRETITLAEALAAAGGPTPAMARKEIAVLRGGFAKPTVYTFNLEKGLLYDEMIKLRPGDRVVIAPTGMATASRYMQQLLPFLQGVQALGIAAQGGTNVATQAAAAASSN